MNKCVSIWNDGENYQIVEYEIRSGKYLYYDHNQLFKNLYATKTKAIFNLFNKYRNLNIIDDPKSKFFHSVMIEELDIFYTYE